VRGYYTLPVETMFFKHLFGNRDMASAVQATPDRRRQSTGYAAVDRGPRGDTRHQARARGRAETQVMLRIGTTFR